MKKYSLFLSLTLLIGCGRINHVSNTNTPKIVRTNQSIAPTPVGVVVTMSDGSTQTFHLGVWIEFASGTSCSPSCAGGQLRGIFPTQYVNQIATVNSPPPGINAAAKAFVQSDGTLSITIVNGGSGYTNPIISTAGGGGSSGTITVTLASGVITTIVAPNSTGYAVTDNVSITIVDNPIETWIYNRPGRNVQVWRNGLLQRLATCGTDAATCGGDYTINTSTMTITPVPVTLNNGNVINTWNPTDYVTVAYLY